MSKFGKLEVEGLNPKDVFEIAELAKQKRRMFDIGMGPLGDNIFKLVRKMGIYLVYVPVRIDREQENPFSALYVSFEHEGIKLHFIGLNTEDYYDKQIFALAHELYHHFETLEFHVCRLSDGPQSLHELKANRFAAEFLLPTDKLISEIQEVNNGSPDLTKWRHTALLRLIAKIHCEYRLPYKAIVRRFREIEAVSTEQFDILLRELARDKDSPYYLTGINMDAIIFDLLNKSTRKYGVDGEDLNKILDNCENGLISSAELAKDLKLFRKSIGDFAPEEEIDPDDLKDLEELFGSHNNES